MTNVPIPVMKALRKMGQDINDARRRRRITIELMAERAGLSRATIGKIEKGDPTTSMGGYASVLFLSQLNARSLFVKNLTRTPCDAAIAS